MSKKLDITDATTEEGACASKDPLYSPVFLSPGGSFHKAQKIALPITPTSKDSSHDKERATYPGEEEAAGGEEETGVDVDSMRIASGEGEGEEGEQAPEDRDKPDSCAMDEEEGISLPLSQGYVDMLMQEPLVVPAEPIEAKEIDVTDDECPPTDGVSWGIRKGDYNLLGLFGGAITIELPAGFEDMSALRQVPDHQEVFLHKDLDISFIVELLGADEEVPDAEAAAYYFTDLCEVNEAEGAVIGEQCIFPNDSIMPGMREVPHSVCALSGVQNVYKIRDGNSEKTLDTVRMLLVVLRLPSVGTDVLLSMNMPRAENAPDKLPPLSALLSANAATDASVGGKAMKMAVSSFTVHDWSLLG